MNNNYVISEYTVIFHKGSGDTEKNRVFFCKTSAEIGKILEEEFWCYWDSFKVFAKVFNMDTGMFETIQLP